MTTDPALLSLVRGVHETFDPAALFKRVVGTPVPFQLQLLRSASPFVVLLASRQVGKSETLACLAAHELAYRPGSFVLILCPSERQSREVYKRVLRYKDALGLCAVRSTMTEMELDSGSRLVSLPSSSDTIRGFAGASTIIFDEAAYFGDKGDAITVVMPMRAANGRIIVASTPNGRNNLFAELWFDSKGAEKISARSVDIPRLAEKVTFDRTYMPELRFRVEHLCDFDVSGGTPFFSLDAVRNAFTEERQPLWPTTTTLQTAA